jgi:enoyl-CoA hydratase/carnithine racemase
MSRELQRLQVSVDGPLATVAFNRPEVLNATDMRTLDELIDVFDDLNGDLSLRCVVVKGNGRAFSVGADQKERPGLTDDELRRRRRIAPRAFGAMRDCVHPVITQVHGFAFGGGLELALGGDLAVAAESTVMGLVETKRGMIPGGGGTQLLPRLVGPFRAKELVLTGRRFSATEAAAWGLVNYVVADDELPARVAELAREICSVAPVASRQAKRALEAALELDFRRGVEFEAALYERVLHTEDRFIAQRAFHDHVDPEFLGR